MYDTKISNKLMTWTDRARAIKSLPRYMFWVAFGIRVLVLTVTGKYHLRAHYDHFEFGWEMGRIARALVTGYGYADPFNGHTGPSAWVPPLYPFLLAGVFKIFGVYTLKSAWVILTLNSAFSAAIAPAIYELAWRSFARDPRGASIAAWSGWLWALYPAALQYAIHWVWEMSLSTALLAWIVVVAFRVRAIGEKTPTRWTGQRTRLWGIFGLLWGLVALSNSSLLSFFPFCILWMIYPERKNHLIRSLKNISLASVLCGLLICPWIIRNWITLHAFVPMRANFGAELFESARPANEGFPVPATLALADTNPDYIRYKTLGELAYSREQGVKALAIIRSDRKLFAERAVERLFFFWASVPHPVDKSVAAELVREANFGFISIGGILGLALALRNRIPGAWLFLWAFITLPFVYYFVTVQARFRHPLEPMMTILIVYLFQSAERPTQIFGGRRTAASALR